MVSPVKTTEHQTAHSAEATQKLSPVPLMQLVSGFWAFKTLAAAIELNLCDLLSGGNGRTLEQAARELKLERRPADMLLAACASLGLLDKTSGLYHNTDLAEAFLVQGKPYYIGGLVRYCDQREYLPWHDVVTALRTNRPTTWDPDKQESLFTTDDHVMMELFWEATHTLSSSTAQQLAAAHDFSEHKSLLDVGGGSGSYPIELCRQYPHLTATVYDLEHVCGIAKEKIAAAGLESRIATAAGDFLKDAALPTGHDIVLLSLILHDWDEDTDRRLLGKCFAALPSGGSIVISELLLNDERTGPPDAALMGMTMIVETQGGKNYSGAEYREWLTDTGFTDIQLVRIEALGSNGVLIARKP
jgi:3-hydroxy-5-methyl-1-naphthoate 3-O-methyltransferase